MKKVFNGDVVLTTKRTAAKISEEGLRDKIIQEASKYTVHPVYLREPGNLNNKLVEVVWTKDNIAKYPNEYLQRCIDSFFDDDETTDLAKDMEMPDLYCPGAMFDTTFRPWILKPAEKVLLQILGFHTLENGFTFLGFTLQSDDCDQFVVIAYWDGAKLRLYTPKWGNDIDAESVSCWCQNYWHKKAYYEKYGFTPEENVFDVEAMLQDITTTIQVI